MVKWRVAINTYSSYGKLKRSCLKLTCTQELNAIVLIMEMYSGIVAGNSPIRLCNWLLGDSQQVYAYKLTVLKLIIV